MHLNLFQLAKCGHIPGSWRHPDADPEGAGDAEVIIRTAQLAESACFDSIFLADTHSLDRRFAHDEIRLAPDALVLQSLLAAGTRQIGLIATINTSFAAPYDIARKLATLEHLSHGRVGWNVVTGNADAEAQNYGVTALDDPAERYERAAEFVEVARRLWAGWGDDALMFDKGSGDFADPRKVRPVDHHGRFYSCSGPLSVPAVPQGEPVLVQAGQSGPGRDFAARHAEVIFTAQNDLDDALAFSTDIRTRAEACGRDPSTIRILPGLIPIIGETETEALQHEKALRDTLIPALGLEVIKTALGIDLSGFDLDDPAPTDPGVLESLASDRSPDRNLSSRGSLMLEWARREHASVRDLMFAAASRAHLRVVGTGEQVADVMQSWYEAGACDGFNVAPALLPQTLEHFVDQVVPVLRERNLFRTEYSGRTLRDHLELHRSRIDSVGGAALPRESTSE